MEACQRDADLKVQMALAPYRHLPQEIESLKHVVELRNQQIHELRLQKSELERQVRVFFDILENPFDTVMCLPSVSLG